MKLIVAEAGPAAYSDHAARPNDCSAKNRISLQYAVMYMHTCMHAYIHTYMYVYFYVDGNISIYMYTYLCVCIVELIGSWFQGLCWVEVLAPWLGVKSRAGYSYESQFRS